MKIILQRDERGLYSVCPECGTRRDMDYHEFDSEYGHNGVLVVCPEQITCDHVFAVMAPNLDELTVGLIHEQ